MTVASVPVRISGIGVGCAVLERISSGWAESLGRSWLDSRAVELGMRWLQSKPVG